MNAPANGSGNPTAEDAATAAVSDLAMIPGHPPVLLFDGTGAPLRQFPGMSVVAAAGAALPLINDPATELPLTVFDPASNLTVTINGDGVNVRSWAAVKSDRDGSADDPAASCPAVVAPADQTVETGPIDPVLIDLVTGPGDGDGPFDPLERLMEYLAPTGPEGGCMPTLDYITEQWTTATITCEHGHHSGSGLLRGAYLLAALRAAVAWRRAHPALALDTAPAMTGTKTGKAGGTTSRSLRLNLLVLYTDDLLGCQRFYESRGLHFKRGQHNNGPEHLAAELDDGFVLELYPSDETHPAGLVMIGFAVPPETAERHPAGADREGRSDPDGRFVIVTLGPRPPRDDVPRHDR